MPLMTQPTKAIFVGNNNKKLLKILNNINCFSKVLGKLGKWKLRGKIGLRFSQFK